MRQIPWAQGADVRGQVRIVNQGVRVDRQPDGVLVGRQQLAEDFVTPRQQRH